MSEQQIQPAAQEQNPKETLVSLQLRAAYNAAQANYPLMVQSAKNAVAALSKITAIASDETDAIANELLVKVRKTFDKIQGQRMEATKPLDTIKELLMVPEKSISTDKGAASEYNRVKALRDAWANKKYEEAQAEKKRIATEQAQSTEIIRIRSEFERSVTQGQANTLQAAATFYEKSFITVTLETFPSLEAVFERIPALKPEIWASWFTVGYNSTLVTPEVYNGLLLEAKQRFNYESQNAEFIAKCNMLISEWKTKLPGHKAELEHLVKLLADNDAAAAAATKAKMEQEAQAIAQEQTSLIADTAEAAIADVNAKEQDDNMEAAFNAQVSAQEIEEVSGARADKFAVLVCEEESVVVTISELFYQVFIHPKYKGIFKLDKSKQRKHDENGNPIYQDWLEDMLKFYANNCNKTIEGIEVKEKLSTIQKTVKP